MTVWQDASARNCFSHCLLTGSNSIYNIIFITIFHFAFSLGCKTACIFCVFSRMNVHWLKRARKWKERLWRAFSLWASGWASEPRAWQSTLSALRTSWVRTFADSCVLEFQEKKTTVLPFTFGLPPFFFNSVRREEGGGGGSVRENLHVVSHSCDYQQLFKVMLRETALI